MNVSAGLSIVYVIAKLTLGGAFSCAGNVARTTTVPRWVGESCKPRIWFAVKL